MIWRRDGEINFSNGRIGLAYEKLTGIPKPIAERFSARTTILDLSYNNIQWVLSHWLRTINWIIFTKFASYSSDLTFLAGFKLLNSLILDRNTTLDEKTLPYLPNLKLLWWVCEIVRWWPHLGSVHRILYSNRLIVSLFLGWIIVILKILHNGSIASGTAVHPLNTFRWWGILVPLPHLLVELSSSIMTTGVCIILFISSFLKCLIFPDILLSVFCTISIIWMTHTSQRHRNYMHALIAVCTV